MHSGCAGSRANRRKFRSVSDQTISVKRHPFTGIRAGLVGNPQKFFATFFSRSRRSVLWYCLIFQRQSNPLVFRQGERLKGAQYSLLVNGVKVSDHGISIVIVGTARLCPLLVSDALRVISA